MTSRDAAINLAFRAGATIAEIAEATGFDPDRVMAILDKVRVDAVDLLAETLADDSHRHFDKPYDDEGRT